MNKAEYKQCIDCIIYLCSCAINGKEINSDRIKCVSLDDLYNSSANHMLASIVGQVLQRNGYSYEPFNSAVAKNQRKLIILDSEYQNIVSEFESAEIWYMPLKGGVLKDLYPCFAMREMADYDILFDETRANEVKSIMESLDFQVKSFGEKNDDDYFKLPVSNFELHRSLFGNTHDEFLFKYYKNVKDRLLKDENNRYGYHFRPEDFYVFMIAHEYKHYIAGGTGIRSLLDTYIYIKNYKLDMDYISKEVVKLKIDKFEEMNRSLALKLFDGIDLTNEEMNMYEYIIFSGVYGNFKNNIKHKVSQEGGKKAYISKRIFGPNDINDPYYSRYRKKYATFYKYPILLPFLPVYRLFCALTNNPKRLKSEVNALNENKARKKDN